MGSSAIANKDPLSKHPFRMPVATATSGIGNPTTMVFEACMLWLKRIGLRRSHMHEGTKTAICVPNLGMLAPSRRAPQQFRVQPWDSQSRNCGAATVSDAIMPNGFAPNSPNK